MTLHTQWGMQHIQMLLNDFTLLVHEEEEEEEAIFFIHKNFSNETIIKQKYMCSI